MKTSSIRLLGSHQAPSLIKLEIKMLRRAYSSFDSGEKTVDLWEALAQAAEKYVHLQYLKYYSKYFFISVALFKNGNSLIN